MRRTGYEVLGFAVWHGGRWYVRRRLGLTARRARRGVVLAGGAALVAGVAAVVVRSRA